MYNDKNVVKNSDDHPNGLLKMGIPPPSLEDPQRRSLPEVVTIVCPVEGDPAEKGNETEGDLKYGHIGSAKTAKER